MDSIFFFRPFLQYLADAAASLFPAVLHPSMLFPVNTSVYAVKEQTAMERYNAFTVLWHLALPGPPAPSMSRSILEVLLSGDHLLLAGDILEQIRLRGPGAEGRT